MSPDSSAAHATPVPLADPTVKACESCERVSIGADFDEISDTRAFIGLFFVYSPIIFLPFILLAGWLTFVHLRIMGATNLKPLSAFLPDWKTHRYRFKNQIIKDDTNRYAFWCRTRTFWFINCTYYCPVSVAAAAWLTYLVKVVENWWCPFAHGKKPSYADASIDYSYWHISTDAAKLHKEDRDNSIYNQDAPPAR